MDEEISLDFSLKIYTITKADIQPILELWVETINFHSNFDEDFTLSKDGRKNFEFVINTAIYDSSQAVYVAKYEDIVIGFIYGYIKKSSGFFKTKIHAHISDIAVESRFRRKGVGKALIEKFEKEFAKLHKADDLTLYVHVENKEGLEFYDRLNFEKKLVSMKKSIEY